jgi:putative oxidoreductase
MDPLSLVRRARARAERLPHDLIALCARVGLASLFWTSGQTKIVSVTGFTLLGREVGVPATFPPELAAFTPVLFAEEYALPLVPPEVAAWMATLAELTFPILLLVGLGTRLSALGLLTMTLVIQLLVYPSLWGDHLLWAAALLLLIARGPGRLSLDHRVARRWLDRG